MIALIARFHPFHDGHAAILTEALRHGPVVVAVMGEGAPRSSRYPFTVQEQIERVHDAFAEAVSSGALKLMAVPDRLTATETIADVISTLKGVVPERWGAIECDFDPLATGFTLWPVANTSEASAALRDQWFEGAEVDADLAEEHAYLKAYKQSWQAAPYAPTFVTVDTLIRHEGRVLLIQRGGLPGRGQWALPGGFLDEGETLFAAALRELREETGLTLEPSEALRRCRANRVFDQPQRSARGRTITHAFDFDLTGLVLPELAAGDDAAGLAWVAIDEALTWRGRMFEDHFLILEHFLTA